MGKKFSKRHYDDIAFAMCLSRPNWLTQEPEYRQWERSIEAISAKLKSDNPKFNAERFHEACSEVAF
jgi:hypothetical protein